MAVVRRLEVGESWSMILDKGEQTILIFKVTFFLYVRGEGEEGIYNLHREKSTHYEDTT